MLRGSSGARSVCLHFTRNFQQKRSVHDDTRGPAGIVATVFGATGFTGRYVVEALTQVGAQIIVPFRGEERNYAQLKVMGELGQVVPVRFELKDRDSVERAVSHSNVVINLLGRNWETRNYKYADVNFTGAEAIAEASRHVDRFIHVGAACSSKDSPSVWSQTKAKGEEAVREILPFATIIKPTVIYGDEDRFFNKWGHIAATFPLAIPFSGSDMKIQPLHSHEFSKAIIAALGDADSIGKDYVLGGPEVFTWREIIKMIVVDGARRHKRLLEVDIKYLEKLAWLLEQDYEPYYVRDEIRHYNQDVIQKPGELGLKNLGIKSTPILNHLMRVARMYRPHDQFHDVITPLNSGKVPNVIHKDKQLL